MNTFVGVHDKASADAEALFRPGSHSALPRGWRNSLSIQRASERNVCERAMAPYFPRPQIKKTLTPVAILQATGTRVIPAVPPCLTPRGPLRFMCSELPHSLLTFGFHPPELAIREDS
ncbi:hypothetical protein Desmer_3983 [Desulfosporosinus meridiei DSM 13257]|uniref:Uncharacterized protein n=1 Tax=Desulfosporosinus meridiei (strain ATCC BAA-275 / DSM 13257 / KCTC 12902 / NCIMB 13706 / S10) TaxID=768704 RepID=J7J0E2_DESMD|nr:hypothetical protein Desmer_3983 [Desulfosporosinus meridiei DSM 13257]